MTKVFIVLVSVFKNAQFTTLKSIQDPTKMTTKADTENIECDTRSKNKNTEKQIKVSCFLKINRHTI